MITCDPQHSEFRNNAPLSVAVPRVSAAIFAEQSGALQSVEMWKRSRNYSGVVSAPHPAGHSDTVQPLVEG